METNNQNPYTCIVKISDGNWITYHKVNDLVKFCKFLDENFNGINKPKWNFANVFNRKTKEKCGSYLNGKQPTRPMNAREL